MWIDLYVGVVRSADGSARHMVAQMVDVTAEVHSREALSEATRRYQQLAENASDVVLAVDTSGSSGGPRHRSERRSAGSRSWSGDAGDVAGGRR